jgi:hypothetical protein
VSGQHRAPVRTLLRNRSRHASPQLGLHLAELRPRPLPRRLPPHVEAPVSRCRADVRETEEVERLGPPLAAARSVVGRIATELQDARLVGVKLQSELRESLAQLGLECEGVPLVLEAPRRSRQRNPRRSCRRAPAASSIVEPTGRTRSEGTRSPRAG